MTSSEAALEHYEQGKALEKEGHIRDAVKAYEKACGLDAKMLPAHIDLGVLYRTLGNIPKAMEHTKKAIEIDPNFALGHSNLGAFYALSQDFESARESYAKAVEIDPNLVPARTNFAIMLEKMNQIDEAAQVLEDTPEDQKDHPFILFTQARLKRRQKQYDEALELLKRCDETSHSTFYERGHVYDALENYDEAFRCFSKASALWLDMPEAKHQNKEAVFTEIEAYDTLFQSGWVESWNPIVSHDNPPVFLVGFPRSGTTLLDQTLQAHPDITALEERAIIDQSIVYSSQYIKGTLSELATLSAGQIADIQQQYFRMAEDLADLQKGQILVDKMPLNMIATGFIHRIFPNAKIILAVRHPCDCILSCLMQNFTVNRGTLALSDMQDAAKLYTKAFSLFKHYQDTLPDLDVHILRYEDLVSDFESKAKELIAFLDLPWDGSVLRYHEQESDARVTSASYHQVNQPIYTGSLYRWKNYEKYLGPILPMLEPFIEEFGYNED